MLDCITYVHVREETSPVTFADKVYKGFFASNRFLFMCLHWLKSHPIYDKVTPVRRQAEKLLLVDSQHRP